MKHLLHKGYKIGRQTAKTWMGDQYFTVIRAQYDFWRRSLQGQQFIFVHTMGKVASSSIVRSLRASVIGDRLAIYHTHFLSPEGMALAEALAEKGFRGPKQFSTNYKAFLIRSRILS